MSREVAYHEAGHAAADLVFKHAPGRVIVVRKGDTLGSVRQVDGDRDSVEGIRKIVISCYAGAEAERRIRPAADVEAIAAGACADDDEADRWLQLANATEAELRTEAAELVAEHWGLVELIAGELIARNELNGTEAGILYDIYCDRATRKDLDNYRDLLGGNANGQDQSEV